MPVVRFTLSNQRAKAGVSCVHLGFYWNCWRWSQFFKINSNGWRKLVLHVLPKDETAIRRVVESGSLKTSESHAIEIEGENTADCILWCERPASSQINSSRTDGHFYSFLGVMKSLMRHIHRIRSEYHKPSSRSLLHDQALATLQLFWRIIMPKIKSLSYPTPTHSIWLWPTFFCFPKSS